jgi:hypothetical protein
MIMKLVIAPKRLTLCLILGAVFLYLGGLASGFLAMVGLRDGTIVGELVEPFDIANNDASIAAWYSSLLLLLCSILLANITAAKRRLGDRFTLHWGFLSGIFLLLSLDETARLHEALGKASERAVTKFAGFTPEGILGEFWVVPGAIFVLIVGLAYMRFLASLPSRTLVLFVAGGMIFVGSAIGLEVVMAIQSFASAELGQNVEPDYNLTWWMVHLRLEELFEFVGVVVFCYALLSYLNSYGMEMTVGFRTDYEEARGDEVEEHAAAPTRRA